jgi:hypothetical protein
LLQLAILPASARLFARPSSLASSAILILAGIGFAFLDFAGAELGDPAGCSTRSFTT